MIFKNKYYKFDGEVAPELKRNYRGGSINCVFIALPNLTHSKTLGLVFYQICKKKNDDVK